MAWWTEIKTPYNRRLAQWRVIRQETDRRWLIEQSNSHSRSCGKRVRLAILLDSKKHEYEYEKI
jgi:hypothetical protein